MFHIFFAVRPLLILALATGAIIFAPQPQEAQKERPENVNENELTTTSTETGVLSEDALMLESAPASVFDTLFGKGTTDPLFKLPEGPVVGTRGQNLPEQEPQTEPQGSIYRYLVTASDIGFKSDASRLKLALATAEQGETGALKSLIEEMQGDLDAFKRLDPPEELREAHEESNRVVLQYIHLLENVLTQAPNGVMTTWQSEERDAVVERAKEVNQKLQDIVHKYNISLPEGVLP